MSFENLKQLTRGTATITIDGITEEVHLLTVKQREEYENILNKGLGNIQTSLGRSTEQKANMNVEKVNKSQQAANRYLVLNSGITHENGTAITEEDIDQLYSIYPRLVKELKRVNDIIEVEDETMLKAVQNKNENDLKNF